MPREQCRSLGQCVSPSSIPTPSPAVCVDGADMGDTEPDIGDAESGDDNGIHVNCTILTDEQFQMLFSYAVGNRVSDNIDSTGSAFTVPPFPFVNPVGDNPKSFLDLFPLVPRETILEVINFEFFHSDLYKLDPTSLGASTEYPTLASLIGPLSIYFQILACYAASSNSASAVLAIHRASFAYSAHLSSLNRTYEWSAVLRYHSQFFFRRSREMTRGEFSGWLSPDIELTGEVLFGHNRIDPNFFKASSLLVVSILIPLTYIYVAFLLHLPSI